MSRTTVWRRRLVALAAVVLALLAGYLLWLRDSSLFAVEEVQVHGVTANRTAITGALERAARTMTTLHVRGDVLRQAVEGFPTVASISAQATLLHKLEIDVTERLPVAKARIGGSPVPVSADGYVLEGAAFKPGELPSIEASAGPGGRVDPDGAAQAAIVGAVPKALRDRLRSARWDDAEGGVVVDLKGAPQLRFGDGERAADKWEAAAAVLSRLGSESPSYLDVSVPQRPVTG
jgi:cell division protein FtsQ